MADINQLNIPGYHKVIEGIDTKNGLHCFIAVHDCTLGPAMGGTRFFQYRNKEEALSDVLQLARAMTYKSAIAEDGFGGGKSVIIGDPKKIKTKNLLHSFGEIINNLQGLYIAAEDVGTNTEDLKIISETTPYVAALETEKSSGDPSRFTAWGVFRGIQAVAEKLWGSTSLRKKKIAIQGLGSVGAKLANILFWEGAELILSDIDAEKAHDIALLDGALIVSPDEITSVHCDIFAPCAMGGIINPKTIPHLKCKAIAGAANNQLHSVDEGLDLMKRKILYAPDYVINAGGIINASLEFYPKGYDPRISRDKVNHIYDTLHMIFERSEKEQKPTNQVADELAEYNIKHKVGKRKQPITFQ